MCSSLAISQNIQYCTLSISLMYILINLKKFQCSPLPKLSIHCILYQNVYFMFYLKWIQIQKNNHFQNKSFSFWNCERIQQNS